MILFAEYPEYAVKDAGGRRLSDAEARLAWEEGRVTDCNLSFRRLAEYGFDRARLAAYYATADNK